MDEYTETTLGFEEMAISWHLLVLLRKLKAADPERGREWAIAATDAEKLHAWISYVVAMVPEEA